MKQVLMFLLVMILSFGPIAEAVEEIERGLKKTEILAGISYTNFNIPVLHADLPKDGFESAFGFYAGGKRLITEQLSVTGKYEKFSVTHNRELVNLTLNGISGVMSYNIRPEGSFYLSLKGGLGYYFGNVRGIVEDGEIILNYKGTPLPFGLKTGIGLGQEIASDIKVAIKIFYRSLHMDVIRAKKGYSDPVDMSGLKVSGGIIHKF